MHEKAFPDKLLLEPSESIRVKRWFDKNKKNPEFKHLVIKAYRDWTAMVYINNKRVMHTSTAMASIENDMSSLGAP